MKYSRSRLALAMILGMTAIPAMAQPVEGRDYIELSPAQPTIDPGRIVVTEFFSYQCPHCFTFHHPLRDFANALPDDVVFERVADSIGKSNWVPIMRAYYALDSMGEIGAVDDAIFDAIHRQGVRLFDQEAIASWVGQQGIDQAEFTAIYDSFGIESLVRKADQRSRAHRIDSIPTLIVDGTYMVRILDDGVFDSQLDVVAHLIDKVRTERGLSRPAD